MPVAPDVAGVPSAEELAALPHEELAARLAEAYQVIAGLTARVELLERRAGRDSSSSKPPSSDSPYQKKPRDRSLRERGKRRPGKQPGEPGTTMKLADDPDHRLWFPPSSCREGELSLPNMEYSSRHLFDGLVEQHRQHPDHESDQLCPRRSAETARFTAWKALRVLVDEGLPQCSRSSGVCVHRKVKERSLVPLCAYPGTGCLQSVAHVNLQAVAHVNLYGS